MMKSTLAKDILGIVAMSFFLGLSYNYFSPKGISLLRKEPVKTVVGDSALFGSSISVTDTTKQESVQIIPKEVKQKETQPSSKKEDAGVHIVTLEQVKRLMNSGNVLLIDARNAEEFERGHIKGAVNIPYMEVEKYFEKLLEFPTDTLIVIYCNNPECPLGHSLMKFMAQMEFQKLYLYDEGWDGWKNAGMPIERGKKE
jgi:rhodanese-related sulfurtransferase